jgi:hypothetical protein
VTDPELERAIEDEYARRCERAASRAFDWMVREGATHQDIEDDGIVNAQFTLNGIDYFIGPSTLDLDYAIELEVGALIYEDPPFDPETLDAMMAQHISHIAQEEELLFIENGDAGLWAICRFEGNGLDADADFDHRIRQLIALAEAAHGAVRP